MDRRLAALQSHVAAGPAAGAAEKTRNAAEVEEAEAQEEVEVGLGVSTTGGQVAPEAVGVQHEMVPMRDGVRVSLYVYTPPGAGPWHALLTQVYADVSGRGDAFRSLAAHGYAVVVANFRGCQRSEGRYQGYRAVAADGFDTCGWLAAQPWCSGKVGSFGGSQAGFAQNFLVQHGTPIRAAGRGVIRMLLSIFCMTITNESYEAASG
jgi:predicted acyl esterase